MDREQTKRAIDVMQAYVDGAEIESTMLENCWGMATPAWNWGNNAYRVKIATKPSINWDHVHPDYKWLARDKDGGPFFYTKRPSCGRGTWHRPSGSGMNGADTFASYTPGDCDWKDSLVERPE